MEQDSVRAPFGSELREALRPLAALIASPTGRILYGYAEAPDPLGVIEGACWADFVDNGGDPHGNHLADIVERALATDGPVHGTGRVRGVGEAAVSAVSLHPLQPGWDSAVQLVIRPLRRLREFDRTRDEFLSSASHELRTPLAAIKGFATTLRQDPDMPGEQRVEFLSIIERETDRLKALIEDILQAARVSAGPLTPDGSVDSLQGALMQVEAELLPRFVARGVGLDFAIPSDLPTVEVHPKQMARAFVYLVDNALASSPAEGQVTVAARSDPTNVYIEIADHGEPIPSSDIPRLFERFSKAKRVRAARQGSGLGLFLAQRIVEAHKGTITVESNDAHGTVFTVALPRPSGA